VSDPIPFALDLPDDADPLAYIADLLELAGSVPDRLFVTAKTDRADRVEVWKGLVSDAAVDGDGDDTYVSGSARAEAAASLMEAAEDDALELTWRIVYWKDDEGEAMTPASDNEIRVRLNCREEPRFHEPGAVELAIAVNSHTTDPDVEDVAEIIADHVGLSLG
jgi:hypothetical protein